LVAGLVVKVVRDGADMQKTVIQETQETQEIQEAVLAVVVVLVDLLTEQTMVLVAKVLVDLVPVEKFMFTLDRI
jgi:hypothetical protein